MALQIEYSLIERTVEGELMPMALELGLGVTPWSPLRGGVLTGKYTRENVKDAKPGRGERVTASLNERSFAIIDELVRIAGEARDDARRAWRSPGCCAGQASPRSIIGARGVDQLEQNLAAFDVALDTDDMTALDRVSAPTLGFPHMPLANANMIMHGGTTVNGEPSAAWPMAAGDRRRALLNARRAVQRRDRLVQVSAIVAAGGRGQRFGGERPKQLQTLGGRAILERSVTALLNHPAIDEVVVALPADVLADPPPYLRVAGKPLKLVAGGERRQDSVANAFAVVSESAAVIVIHDAARPFVSDDLIERTIAAALESGAAIAAAAGARHRETGRKRDELQMTARR